MRAVGRGVIGKRLGGCEKVQRCKSLKENKKNRKGEMETNIPWT